MNPVFRFFLRSSEKIYFDEIKPTDERDERNINSSTMRFVPPPFGSISTGETFFFEGVPTLRRQRRPGVISACRSTIGRPDTIWVSNGLDPRLTEKHLNHICKSPTHIDENSSR